MTTKPPLDTTQWTLELESRIEQLKAETVTLALLGLVIWAVGVLATVAHGQPPLGALLSCVPLFGAAFVAWLARRRHYVVSACALIGGYLAGIYLIIVPGHLPEAIVLLILPVGLATLMITRVAGIASATLVTLWLLSSLSAPDAFSAGLKFVAITAIWGTIGMIWLTFRPLTDVIHWTWHRYEYNEALLERTRDFQAKLMQALEDLKTSNEQLTRMNSIAHGLRKAAEDERRAKEQFVANVSHELRTPLNMIIGFCEMIIQSPQTYSWNMPEPLLADLSVVLRNSRHLSNLVDDVLDLSQIEAGQMALSKERSIIPEIIAAAVIAIRPLYQSKHLFLETEVADNLPAVYCDRTRIREVILNLLSNAGRFTEQGGVRIRAWQDGRNVVISVADSGPGIPLEEQSRLFQPFQQLDGTIHRRHGGTGLGLSISKSFIELHEGRIWVESERDIGTTFFFTLPVDPPLPLESTALRWFNPHFVYEPRDRSHSDTLDHTRPRLAVVERNRAVQHLLSRYMHNAEISTYVSLDEAIREISQMPVQALIVNDNHVEQALIQVEHCEELPYGIPAIVCSLTSVEQAAETLGIANYLLKPVSRDALLASLDRVDGVISTILVVDDEQDAVQLFQRMLVSAERGYRVLRATSGQQALQLMRRQRPHVILLDQIMPDMNGFQFIEEKNRTGYSEIPVIIVSATDPFGQPVTCKSLAVTSKRGFSTQQLMAAIEGICTLMSASAPQSDPTAVETARG